jgi:hypothetical protein
MPGSGRCDAGGSFFAAVDRQRDFGSDVVVNDNENLR